MSLRLALLPLCLLAALPAVAQERGLDVRDLVKLDRVSSPLLTSDGRQLVFAQRTLDFDSGKATTALYARNLLTRDMAPPKRITPDGWNVNSPALSADGQTVYFLSSKNGSSQVFAMPIAGGAPRQLTDVAVDIGTFQISPDGTRVAFSADTFGECAADLACTKRKFAETKDAKASGVVYDQLFVRHWDTWKDGRNSVLYFHVRDVVRVFEDCVAKGARSERAPALAARIPDHDLWIGFLRDPDGNLVGLMEEVRGEARDAG